MMRLIGGPAVALVMAMAVAVSGSADPALPQSIQPAAGANGTEFRSAERLDQPHRDGRWIFRFDTFGDEQFWTDVLRMHEVIATIDPATALAVGLKVDAAALPARLLRDLRGGRVDLADPAVTVDLVRRDAVVGIRGAVDAQGRLTSVGVTCALCHSSVDDAVAPGVGRRLDGWANGDLDVGAIVALSPALDEPTKAEFRTWGPGMYDPRHHAFDGMNLVPLNSPSLPIVIPPIYGLRGVGFETYTGDGPISYWNSYVGVGQMGGKGTFRDPRIGLFIAQTPDLVTPALAALREYQLSLHPPRPAASAIDRKAMERGKLLFRTRARCSSCHQGSTFTDVLSAPQRGRPFLHEAAETGMDAGYAARSATGRYRTTPLRGLLQHAPYFHDGSARDLPAVVEHYDSQFGLRLTARQKSDLVEYLKTL